MRREGSATAPAKTSTKVRLRSHRKLSLAPSLVAPSSFVPSSASYLSSASSKQLPSLGAESTLPPSPLDSDESISNQARYLPFLKMAAAPHTDIYPFIYMSAIYLKKEDARRHADDQLLFQKVSSHLVVHPTQGLSAKTQLGGELMSNGYVLAAIAVAVGRLNGSPILIESLFTLFSSLPMIKNAEEFASFRSRSTKDWEAIENKPDVPTALSRSRSRPGEEPLPSKPLPSKPLPSKHLPSKHPLKRLNLGD